MSDYLPAVPRRFYGLIAESCRDIWRLFVPAPSLEPPGASFLARRVVWDRTANDHTPYRARVSGQEWLVRLNPVLNEPFYTLLIDGRAVATFDVWPDAWRDPRSR